LVEDYNHTPHHSCFLWNVYSTSSLIYKRRDLERCFIKENEYKLEKINYFQEEANLKNYKLGNILLISLDFTNIKVSFNKKRKIFNKLTKFIFYDFDNMKCNIYNINEKRIQKRIISLI
jgi:hypothetical protein